MICRSLGCREINPAQSDSHWIRCHCSIPSVHLAGVRNLGRGVFCESRACYEPYIVNHRFGSSEREGGGVGSREHGLFSLARIVGPTLGTWLLSLSSFGGMLFGLWCWRVLRRICVWRRCCCRFVLGNDDGAMTEEGRRRLVLGLCGLRKKMRKHIVTKITL